MTSKPAKTLSEKIAQVENLGNRYLADANAAAERGKQVKADRLYAKGKYWLDRANTLQGLSEPSQQSGANAYLKPSSLAPDEAWLRRAWDMGRKQFTPAAVLADEERTERSWAEDLTALRSQGKTAE